MFKSLSCPGRRADVAHRRNRLTDSLTTSDLHCAASLRHRLTERLQLAEIPMIPTRSLSRHSTKSASSVIHLGPAWRDSSRKHDIPFPCHVTPQS